MISRRHMLLLGGAAALPWPGQAQDAPEAPRIALIMGNAAYPAGIGPLANPVNDAHLIRGAIKTCGFNLVTGDVVVDADRSTMLRAIREYVRQMEAAGPDAIGFFYYSGHGAARENQGNYLIPVEDVDLLDEALWDDSVSLEFLMDKLVALEAPSVVAIDACRNVLRLPEAQRALGGGEAFRGLRRSTGGAGERNMFLSFATWEGETASDGRAEDGGGPYAKSLATRLAAPAVTVRDLFEQVRVDVLERTLQRQEPMNLSRLQRRSIDISIGDEDVVYDPDRIWTPRPNLRHALVIANSHAGAAGQDLPEVAADGEKVRAALQASGYDASLTLDADQAAFRDALDAFRYRLRAAGPAAVGVVYFAGYGTAIAGENYLLPDGPLPEDESGVTARGVPLGEIVSGLESAGAQAVVVLVDCGRPFELMGNKGAEPGFDREFGQNNVVIAYADAPESTHANARDASLFAAAFAARVQSPDRVDIETVMRRVSADVKAQTGGQQTPWFQSSLPLPIYFRESIPWQTPGAE